MAPGQLPSGYTGSGYGGYSGYETEALRQETLKGRRFIDTDRSTRVRQFHSQNTALDHQAQPGFASSFGGDIKVASGDRFGLRTAGDVTNQGVPIGRQYDIINGVSSNEKWRVMPLFDAHSQRIPIHMLPPEERSKVMYNRSKAEVVSVPPTSRTPGVALGPGHKQFVNMNMALNPAGAGLLVGPTKATAVEYHSHNEFKTARHKHSRAVNDPLARSSVPLTSSQEYGWKIAKGEAPPVGSRTNHPVKMCKETRFAQSIMLGSRHKGGYSGQGTL